MDLSDEERAMMWRCRRGLKELDVLLDPFVHQHYASLDEDDKARFRRLVTCEDVDLLDWFLNRVTPPDPDLERIVHVVLERVAA